MKVALNILGLTRLFGGAFAGVLDVARRADLLGIDQVVLGEHLALVEDGIAKYPRGTFAYPLDYPYYEPVTALAAIAAATVRIRLSTNVLVAPLRPALLLARQIATLDLVSAGRVELAFGAGWHREEFEAAEAGFDDRFAYLEEQIRVCRAAWGAAPASHSGRRVRFSGLHMHPPPPQGAGLPIWLGVDATERGVRRVAELADGWAAPPEEPDRLAAGVARVKAALEARGRDWAGFPVRATLKPVRHASGSVDWAATAATVPAYQTAGATMLSVIATQYCRSADELDGFLDRLVALRGSLP